MNARPCLRKAGMSLPPEGLESVVEVLVRHPGVSSGLEVVILLPRAWVACAGGKWGRLWEQEENQFRGD